MRSAAVPVETSFVTLSAPVILVVWLPGALLIGTIVVLSCEMFDCDVMPSANVWYLDWPLSTRTHLLTSASALALATPSWSTTAGPLPRKYTTPFTSRRSNTLVPVVQRSEMTCRPPLGPASPVMLSSAPLSVARST
jgi:hypothetical protein